MNDHTSSRRSNPNLKATSTPAPAAAPCPEPQARLSPRPRALPHHRLLAYQVGLQFASAVRDAAIKDASLRDQALRAAASACLNTAEAAGRETQADRRRAFVIARGEACEAAAAVEIAVAAGFSSKASLPPVLRLGDRLVALLTGLINR